VRFFLVSRKADSEFVFDVDLARQNTLENPVYYVQMAHARVCGVFSQLEDKELVTSTLDKLTNEKELQLALRL
jgi:arginyl-tRNA synthetase